MKQSLFPWCPCCPFLPFLPFFPVARESSPCRARDATTARARLILNAGRGAREGTLSVCARIRAREGRAMRWRRFARRIDAPSSRANACEFDGTTGRKSPGAEAESAGSEGSWTSIAELSCEGVPVEHLAEAQSCVRRGDHAVTRRGLLSTLTPRHLSFTGDSMDGSMGVRARTKGTVRVDRSTRRLFNAFIPAFTQCIHSFD